MSVFGQILGIEERATTTPGIPISNPNAWWGKSEESLTGLEIDERGSLAHTAVYQAVQLISVMCASLPRHVFRRTDDEGRERARDHWLQRLLGREPNPEMSPMSFQIAQYLSKLLWGNRYAEVEFTRGGDRPARLWHILPWRVNIHRVYKRRGGGLTDQKQQATPEDLSRGGELLYEIEDDTSNSIWLPPQKISHVPDLSWNGTKGFSRISKALETIGAGIAAQETRSALFGNFSLPSGVIERPQEAPPLPPNAVKARMAAWEAAHQGVRKTGRVAVLQEGEKYEAITMTPHDSRLLELSEFGILEVAHIFNLAPYWLGHPGNSATYSNVEQEWTNLVRRTLQPHLVADEQEISRSLIPEPEQDQIFVEHETRALLRADSKTRSEVEKTWLEAGAMTPNQIAARENLPPVPADQGGDTYRMPLQLGPAAQTLDDLRSVARRAREILDYHERDRDRPRVTVPDGQELRSRRSLRARQRLRIAYRPLLLSAMQRIVGRETGAISKLLDRAETAPQALEGLEDFYREHWDAVVQIAGPVLTSYMEATGLEAASEVDLSEELARERLDLFAASYREQYATRYVSRHEAELGSLLRDGGLLVGAEKVVSRLEEWKETKAAKEAGWEVVAAESKVSTEMYRTAGHRRKVWQAGDACPICAPMGGRTIEIEKPFLKAGDTVEASDSDTDDLQVQRIIAEPPLHKGCDCGVTAG